MLATDLAAVNFVDLDSIFAFLNDNSVEDIIGLKAIYELNDVAVGSSIARYISLQGTVYMKVINANFISIFIF